MKSSVALFIWLLLGSAAVAAQPTHYDQRSREDYRLREATSRAYNTNAPASRPNNNTSAKTPANTASRSGSSESGSSASPVTGAAHTTTNAQMDAANQKAYDKKYEAAQKARQAEQIADARRDAALAENAANLDRILGQQSITELQAAIKAAGVSIEPNNYSQLRNLARKANFKSWEAESMFPAYADQWARRKTEYQTAFPSAVAWPPAAANEVNTKPFTVEDAAAIDKGLREERLRIRKSELLRMMNEMNIELKYDNVADLRFVAQKAGYTYEESMAMFPLFEHDWENRKKDW